MTDTSNENNSPDTPYRPYRVELPYRCSFSIPEDGRITTITIDTRSEELRYGKDEKDIHHQKSAENKHSRPTYAKHILEWTHNHLYSIDPRECEVEYQKGMVIEPMTQEQVNEYREGCLES